MAFKILPSDTPRHLLNHYQATTWSCANPQGKRTENLDNFQELEDFMMASEAQGRCEALILSFDSQGHRATTRMAWNGETWSILAQDRNPDRDFETPNKHRALQLDHLPRYS